jgi:hypothetical protein
MTKEYCATTPASVAGARSSVWVSATAVLIYMALGTVILHALVGNRYGFHADELAWTTPAILPGATPPTRL